MTGKHAADQPRSGLARITAVASAVAALALGSGAAIAGFAPAPTQRPATAEPAATGSAPQPRTSERVSRQERAPSASPSPSRAPRTPSRPAPRVVDEGSCGTSYYGEPQGTANGERFNPDALTAAHKTLPFNTRVRVANPKNGKSVVVRINDRGPYIDGRCLDLSREAFRRIAPLGAGVIQAEYQVLG